MVITSDKYDVEMIGKSIFEVRMVLVIRKFQPRDVGSYRCIAKNSLGEVESNIRLYGEFCLAGRNTVQQVSNSIV
jgi:hypothetical protein